MRPLILYHGPGCADGFCAAWIAHRYFGDDADYLPVQYGQEPPDVRDRRVWILDFSYKRPVLEAMGAVAAGLIVLDHHKTAQAELAEVRYQCPGFVRFDMNKSGGRLTWEHFYPGKEAPWLVAFTEDRDLWTWKLPSSREVSAALASRPRTFEEWDRLGAMPGPGPLADEGAAILRYQAEQVEAQVKHAAEIDLDGHRVLAVNATMLISEITGRLAEGRPFGASYFIRGDGKRVWSLRSRDGGMDVSEVAKRRGGGGHRNAAGFEE